MKNPKTNVSGRTRLWRGAQPIESAHTAPQDDQETPSAAELVSRDPHAPAKPHRAGVDELDELGRRQRGVVGKRDPKRWEKR